jgi:molybdopterin-guanine dinucleotide biosynthesis protein A
MRTGGIVLCGGKSSRMGFPKALLPFGPELMLQRVVRILSEVVSPIVVVAAHDQQLPPLPVEVLLARDQRPERGPLEGLLAGLSALLDRADAAYATSCDVPLLQPNFIRHMIDRLGEQDIAVPVEEKFQHPLAAVYRTSVVPHIEDLLARDQLRPAFLFDRTRTIRVPVEELRTSDFELSTLANLNRPDDYFAALQAAGFGVPQGLTESINRAPQSPELEL